MTLETLPWDSARYLKTKEDVADYLELAFRENDPAEIAHAIGVVARSEGMSQIARETGLSRESLYRALSRDGNPEMTTVLKVMRALGLRLTVSPDSTAAE